MRGILLALGPRFYPATAAIAAPLLPVYDKPLIDYSLSVLFSAGVRRILIIAAPADAPLLQRHLGGGAQWGAHLSYLIAPPFDSPARALALGGEFIGRRKAALARADRILFGRGLAARLQKAARFKYGAAVFTGHDGADAGLGFYDRKAAEFARAFDDHGDHADLADGYRRAGKLREERLSRAVKVLRIADADSLLAAARAVKTAQDRRAALIGCPEESAWRAGFIGGEQLRALAMGAGQTRHANYLRQLVESGAPA